VIKIVTDSASGITPQVAQQLGITLVPLYVHFGTETFRDGIDLQLPEFFSRLKAAPQLPTTSQPSAGDFVEVYRPLMADGHEVVSIHLSSRLSGTVTSALTAQGMLPGCQVHVVDSMFIASAEALMTVEAARMAAAGQGVEAILARLRQFVAGFHIYFVVDTLEYLQKGGRIGKAAALLGTALQMKPILSVTDGAVEAKERIRTKSKALARLVDLVVEESAGRSRVYLGVLHAGALEEARELEAKLRERVTPTECMIFEIGPVIATHTGPGAVGVAFYAE